jgi:hypothetical protein
MSVICGSFVVCALATRLYQRFIFDKDDKSPDLASNGRSGLLLLEALKEREEEGIYSAPR